VLSRRGASAAGRLSARLDIETATPTPDGAGGSEPVWSAVATVSAELVPLKAEERDVGEGLGDLVTHRIVIRKRADVAPGDRFRLGTRLFRIRSATDPEEDGRFLVCLCEEEGTP